MKTLLGVLTLTGVLAFGYGCNRDEEIQREDIQREEAMDADDIRETDNYRSVPVESDDEVEVDRDVLGDDEIEIDD